MARRGAMASLAAEALAEAGPRRRRRLREEDAGFRYSKRYLAIVARNVMIPRTGSYGETPTVTRSPGTTLMRKRRIRPLNCASTSCPASHWTRYNPPE